MKEKILIFHFIEDGTGGFPQLQLSIICLLTRLAQEVDKNSKCSSTDDMCILMYKK